MKAVYKEKIGDLTVVRHIMDATVDAEKTKEKIAPMIAGEMSAEEAERLYMDNLVYAKVGGEADLIGESEAAEIQQKLDGAGANRLLLDNGEYVADYRGMEYWIKQSGAWVKEQVGELGVSLPGGAVLQEDLTKEQQDEMAAQREDERIAGLTPEQKAEEKRSKLHALAREAITKEREAELLEEDFDTQAWLQPRREEIELLYA
jgi:hypothetical protein